MIKIQTFFRSSRRCIYITIKKQAKKKKPPQVLKHLLRILHKNIAFYSFVLQFLKTKPDHKDEKGSLNINTVFNFSFHQVTSQLHISHSSLFLFYCAKGLQIKKTYKQTIYSTKIKKRRLKGGF